MKRILLLASLVSLSCAVRAETVMKRLNVYAAANGLPIWVQETGYPDLSLFTAGVRTGFSLFVR